MGAGPPKVLFSGDPRPRSRVSSHAPTRDHRRAWRAPHGTLTRPLFPQAFDALTGDRRGAAVGAQPVPPRALRRGPDRGHRRAARPAPQWLPPPPFGAPSRLLPCRRGGGGGGGGGPAVALHGRAKPARSHPQQPPLPPEPAPQSLTPPFLLHGSPDGAEARPRPAASSVAPTRRKPMRRGWGRPEGLASNRLPNSRRIDRISVQSEAPVTGREVLEEGIRVPRRRRRRCSRKQSDGGAAQWTRGWKGLRLLIHPAISYPGPWVCPPGRGTLLGRPRVPSRCSVQSSLIEPSSSSVVLPQRLAAGCLQTKGLESRLTLAFVRRPCSSAAVEATSPSPSMFGLSRLLSACVGWRRSWYQKE
ncbi:serine/arginine-rich splicing factor SR45-like [Cebus imitator]|uniref:serine/arginine-rich splicing factor SR45-like n=1 Tax=Cebus imitator TaxID=2715852 RepID=UPI00189747B6|nr:serine/arginine-rich splicing factor SR45-like [Cebus imitator]